MSWKLKYEILENECLGKGNYGAVYLAKRKNEDTKICVKLIQQKLQFGLNVLQTYAMNEFEIANQMKGNKFINLVNIYDVYQEDKNQYAYIFMEKCDGNILDFLKKKNQKTMDDTQIDELIRQISNGYCELSENKIIHRDLKPENILYNVDVMGNLIFKIADFGLGKIVQESSIDMTCSVGTPFYRAPEVINDEQYDNKCDLYSLGVIIYYMIVGEEKFNKEFKNHEVIQEQLKDKKFSEIISLPIQPFQFDYTDLLDQLINVNPNKRSTWKDLTKWFPQIHTRPRNYTVGAVPQNKFQTQNPNQFQKQPTFNFDEQQESTPTGRNSINPQNNQQNQNLQNAGSPLQNKFQQQTQVVPDFNLQQQQTKQIISQNNFPMNNQFSQIQSGQFQKNIRFQTNAQQNNQFQIQSNNNQADNPNQFIQPTNNVQQNNQRFQTMCNNNNQTQNPNQNIQIIQPTTNVQQNTQFQNNNNQAQNSSVQQKSRFQTQTGQQSNNPPDFTQQNNNNFQNNFFRQQSEKNFKLLQNSFISNKQGFQNVVISFPQKSGIQQNPFLQQNQKPQESNKNNNIDSASTSGQISQEIKQKEI